MKSKFCFHSIAVYDGFSFCRLKSSIISECDKKEPRKNKKYNYSFLSLYTAVDMDQTILFSVTFRKMFGKCSESCYYPRDLKAEVACKDPAYEVIVFSALYIFLLKKL